MIIRICTDFFSVPVDPHKHVVDVEENEHGERLLRVCEISGDMTTEMTTPCTDPTGFMAAFDRAVEMGFAYLDANKFFARVPRDPA